MKRYILVLVLLVITGCTEIKVKDEPALGTYQAKNTFPKRTEIVDFSDHGSINGDVIWTMIVRDTKTEQEFLVFKSGATGITMQPIR